MEHAPGTPAQTRTAILLRKIACINSGLIILLALFFFIYPPIRAFLNIRDPALTQPGIPKSAWRLALNLTPRYAAWAKERVALSRAENLSLDNISGTEWPLFGSVFYLWAIENLQAASDAGDHTAGVEPKVFCRDAIIAASELVIDPHQAAWVRKHWGDDYLHRENVFYRMLVIAALTSRQNLLHDGAHLDLLRDQVETFSHELDASPHGLLDDYPGQCYPGDVMAALACIHRADAVLGTDHSGFLRRAMRGLIGPNSTRLQLPPYMADATTGRPITLARGCANSYICTTSPELWPDVAKRWYQNYDTFFWQHRWSADGYREYPKGTPGSDWTMDVDAGPVIAGHGISACAFGVGAARKNGRFDRAFPLAAEMLATVWELPNGSLAMPRLLSNLSDAPLLGEAGILWQLTIQPQPGFPVTPGGTVLPAFVYILLSASLLIGVWLIIASIRKIYLSGRGAARIIPGPRFQIALWAGLFIVSLPLLWTSHWWMGVLALMLALLLPIGNQAPLDESDNQDQSSPQKPASAAPPGR